MGFLSIVQYIKFGSYPVRLKIAHFRRVLQMKRFPYGQMASCPGKKTYALPKKAVVLLYPMRASPVSARLSLSPRVFLRNQRRENRESFSRPFLSSAPAFLPGQQGDGSKRPAKLEMIQISSSHEKFLDKPNLINYIYQYSLISQKPK